MTPIENATPAIVCVGCDTVLLFESLRGVRSNEGLKGYELKDSFMGGVEADLAMLAASRLPTAEPLRGLRPLRRARGVRARERRAGPAPQDRRAPCGHE